MRTPPDLLSLFKNMEIMSSKVSYYHYQTVKKNKMKVILCDIGMEKPGKGVLLPFNREVA